MEEFDLSKLSNEELDKQLYKEFLYYNEELLELARIIRKQIPVRMTYRLLSKLYSLRKQ